MLRMVALLATATLLLTTACGKVAQADTSPFAQAERAMQVGDQDTAKTLYQTFLHMAPEHPLAKVARQRILIIDRQREAVTKSQGGAVPDYVNPLAKTAEATPPAAAP